MGYRAALSFCRECGSAWAEGASACIHCGTPRVEARPAPVGMSTAAGLASSLALYFVLLATVLAPLLIESDDLLGMLDTLLLVDTVIVAVWAIIHRQDLAAPLRTLGEGRYWAIALAAVPITLGIAYANLWLATDVLGGFDVDLAALYLDAGYSLPMVLLVCAVQPAIVEEIAFRGIMFERLQTIVDPKAAIVMVAIGFMTLHLSFLSAIFLIGLGLLTGWLRWKSGSMYPAIALHLLHNGAVALLSYSGVW